MKAQYDIQKRELILHSDVEKTNVTLKVNNQVINIPKIDKILRLECEKPNQFVYVNDEQIRVGFLIRKPTIIEPETENKTQLNNAQGLDLINVTNNSYIDTYGLEGAGMRVGLLDSQVYEHKEFSNDTGGDTSRVKYVEFSGDNNTHGTHVCGTMAAYGYNPDAKGVAGKVDIYSYSFGQSSGNNWDVNTQTLVGTYNVYAINNSWGAVLGWNYYNGSWYYDGITLEFYLNNLPVPGELYNPFGTYTDNAQTVDQLSQDNQKLILCWACGNDRGESFPDDEQYWYIYSTTLVGYVQLDRDVYPPPPTSDPNYDTVGWFPGAKNCITVGACYNNRIETAPFSGWGPTDDLRIKPDVVADGVSVLSTLNTGFEDYGRLSGTSMATPFVTGCSILIQEFFKKQLTVGVLPDGSMTKACIIHGANAMDNGIIQINGKHGYGIPDMSNTLGLLSDKKTGGDVLVESGILSNSITEDTYTFNNTTNQKVVATLVYTDSPGTPSTTINDPTKKIVNQLGLYIEHGGTYYYPYRIESDRTVNAVQKTSSSFDSSLLVNYDNVQKIIIDTALTGAVTVKVRRLNTLDSAQPYSLLVSNYVESRTVTINQEFIDNLTEPYILQNIQTATVTEDLVITNANQYIQMEAGSTANGQSKNLAYQTSTYAGLFRGDTAGLTNDVTEYYYLVEIDNTTSLPLTLKPNQTGKIIDNISITSSSEQITLANNCLIEGQAYQVTINAATYNGLFVLGNNQSVIINNLSIDASASQINRAVLIDANGVSNSSLTGEGINIRANISENNTGAYIGDANGIIVNLINCYHLGTVSGNNSGGFFGINAGECILSKGYHIGTVSSNSGGISGSGNPNLEYVYSQNSLNKGQLIQPVNTYAYTTWNDAQAENDLGNGWDSYFFKYSTTNTPFGLNYFGNSPFSLSTYSNANTLATNNPGSEIEINQTFINGLSSPYTLTSGNSALVTENLVITQEYQYIQMESGSTASGQNKMVSYQPETYTNLFRGTTSGLINNVTEFFYLVNITSANLLPLVLKPNQNAKLSKNLNLTDASKTITLGDNSIVDGQGYQVSVMTSTFSGLLISSNKTATIKNLSLNISNSTVITGSALVAVNGGNLTITGVNLRANLDQENTGGFIGDANGTTATLTNCYHLGSVTGTSAGGFFGVNATNCSLINGYHIGDVGTNSGGISGTQTGTLSNVYSEGRLIAGSSAVIPDTYVFTSWSDVDAQSAIGGALGTVFFSFNSTTSRSLFLNGQPWGLSYYTQSPFLASNYPSANSLAVNCIMEGMKVLVNEFGKNKYIEIENIRSGDTLVTPQGLKKVLRVGRIWYDGTDETSRPMLIPKDYYCKGLPSEDTYISAKHHLIYEKDEEENKVLTNGKERDNKIWYQGSKIGQEVDLKKLFGDKKGIYYYHLVVEDNATFYVNNLQSESINELKFKRNFEEIGNELVL